MKLDQGLRKKSDLILISDLKSLVSQERDTQRAVEIPPPPVFARRPAKRGDVAIPTCRLTPTGLLRFARKDRSSGPIRRDFGEAMREEVGQDIS